MRIAIMQPYFFPYLGYFSLIKNTDRFIIFDTCKFIRHGWIDRNRILKPRGEWQYISIPLEKHERNTNIKDIKVRTNEDWVKRIINQIEHYKKKAPYYDEVISIVREATNVDSKSLVDHNVHSLNTVCEYIGIRFNFSVFSKMELKIEPVEGPDEWALNICKALGDINEYWNPPGGLAFFDRQKYDDANIKLVFHNIKNEPYIQKIGYFEPFLSIIDVMMFNPPEKINSMLDNYEVI